MQQLFERYGAIEDIHIPLDYFTRERRGFGYVTFYAPVDARDAKTHTDGIPLLGKCMHVMYAATEPLSKFWHVLYLAKYFALIGIESEKLL